MKPSDICLAVLVAVIWGLGFVASRWALDDLPPTLMTTLRFAIAAVPCLFVRRPNVSWPLLIAISFSPYAPFTVDLAKRARRAGVPIVVVTDSALSPLAGVADVRFEVVESDFGSFRSLSATFCLAMTLAVAVGEKRAKA